MKKKLLSLILSVATAMAAVSVPAMAQDGFSDVAGSPYEAAVNALAEQGVVSGRGNGIYAPDEGLTRAEMATIILRAYNMGEIEEDIEKFRDVPPTHWAYRYVETAYQKGIISGMTDTTFEPDAQVTFEQAVRMLVSAMKMDKKAQEAGGWPDGYISAADEAGVLEGIDCSKGQTINRGAMAQLVYNCLDAKTESDYMIDWTEVGEQYNWIRDERMRCIYGDMSDIMEDDSKVVGRLVDAGINCAFINMMGGGYDSRSYEGHQGMLEEATNQKDRYGIKLFMKINWGDNGYVGNTEYGQFHPGIPKDSYFGAPCTLSDEYCDKQLVERSELIASYPAIDGIILDFEMYSGGMSSYTSKCMCDDCWEKYLTAKNYDGEWEKVVAQNRNEYLKKQNKLDEYTVWFENEVTNMFARVREAIHAVNPNIIIGYFPAYDWIPGMTRGLGTPERPVLVASENEYWGSLADTKTRMQHINDDDEVHALYCPGLFAGQSALNPTQLEEKIKTAAPTTAGYWMYDTSYLERNDAYYTAVENGNKQLDEELASGVLTQLPTYEINSYKASKIKEDKPTESEWEKAPFTEDFVQYQSGEKERTLADTRAKVLYSDDYFFVRIYGYDDMSTVSVGEKQLHDGNPWAGDCVEFFWKFDGQSDAAQLVSDLSGSLWDGYSTGIGSINTSVNFEGYTSESKLFDDHWEMTLTVPGTLDGITKIKKGDVLRMEIGRYYPKGNDNYCWAPTYGSYLGASSIWGIVELD